MLAPKTHKSYINKPKKQKQQGKGLCAISAMIGLTYKTLNDITIHTIQKYTHNTHNAHKILKVHTRAHTTEISFVLYK